MRQVLLTANTLVYNGYEFVVSDDVRVGGSLLVLKGRPASLGFVRVKKVDYFIVNGKVNHVSFTADTQYVLNVFYNFKVLGYVVKDGAGVRMVCSGVDGLSVVESGYRGFGVLIEFEEDVRGVVLGGAVLILGRGKEVEVV